MPDYSLSDVLGGQSSFGPSPVLQQPGPQAQADQSWSVMLSNLAKRGAGSQGGGGQSSSLQPARASSSSKGLLSNSRQGLDIDTVIKIVGALYGGGAGAGMGGVAGAASGGGGMSAGIGGYGVGTTPVAAGAPAMSSSSAMGGMGSMFGGGGGMGGGSMFSSLMGGGGVSSQGGSKQGGLNPVLGGYQGKDVGRPQFADLPQPTRGPLVSQSVNAYDLPNYPNWMFS